MRSYLRENRLTVEHLGRGMHGLTRGPRRIYWRPRILLQPFEKRQGVRIGCIEEIAWRMGLISV